MFNFPNPPPIDYYLDDVSPGFLSDGIFHFANPGPTHKCVAKQLRPIDRRIGDPIAPSEQLEPRILDRETAKQKAWFVAPCGKDGPAIQKAKELMDQSNGHFGESKYGKSSIFPRSVQYEIWYIRDKKKRLTEHRRQEILAKEVSVLTKKPADDEPCASTKAFPWKNEDSQHFPLGSSGDYGEQELSNHEGLQCKSSFPAQEIASKNLIIGKHPPVELENSVHLRSRDASFIIDKRWQPIYESTPFPHNDKQRNEELRRLTKPYLHDLHNWYSKNKPTPFT